MNGDVSNKTPGFLDQILVGVVVGLVVTMIVQKNRSS